MTYYKHSYKFRDAPGIDNDATRSRGGEEGAANQDGKLSPESIAKVGSYDTPSFRRDPYHAFQSYLYLVNQDRSAWTWELDRKPTSSIYFCSAED